MIDTATCYNNTAIINIRRGKASENRSDVVYATLVDNTTGETLVSATLCYILEILKERLPIRE